MTPTSLAYGQVTYSQTVNVTFGNITEHDAPIEKHSSSGGVGQARIVNTTDLFDDGSDVFYENTTIINGTEEIFENEAPSDLDEGSVVEVGIPQPVTKEPSLWERFKALIMNLFN